MSLHIRILVLDFGFSGLRQPLNNKRLTPPAFRKSTFKNQKSKISRCLLSGVVFSCLALSVHAEETPRSAMRKGLKAYAAGDYTNAAAMLEKTVLEFPAVGNFNLGNALYRQGEFEKAEAHYTEALRTSDVELQAQAYFNRGNALLARTTAMSGGEQIGRASECAFQAMDMYEKAILLDPQDIDAKQNYERAQQLWLTLEFNRGKWHFDQAETLLSQYKAKDARGHYRNALHQFEHILANIDPTHQESQQYIPKVSGRLDMLQRAVEEAETDLETALRQIDEYQYALAAQRLTKQSDERKYAFDIKPDLQKEYEETIQKNGEVLKIIQDLSSLNIAK